MSEEHPWVALKDVHPMYGYSSVGSAYNAVAAKHFPVETYKLGRMIVIDKVVHQEFFAKHRRVGLTALRNNKSEGQQQQGEDSDAQS